MTRVLIIDDDAPTRDVLCQLLNREGYETVEACNGREGVRCSQAASMDVIILDMLLPEQSGLEVIRALRGVDPAGPIIAISGYGHTGPLDVLRVAETFGVQRTFQKPFHLQELLKAVRDLMQDKDEGPPPSSQW
jgi:two-component system, response regulator, stage 0 sporulation protein F